MARCLRGLIGLALCFSNISLAAAPIRVGFSGSLSGHFGTYGAMITKGLQAAFNNHPCSVGAEKTLVQLVCMDDRGQATRTEQNIKRMQQDGIDLFVGIMGTSGVLKVLPLIQNRAIAVLFPWGTNERLQDAKLTNIINASGLLAPQIDLLVKKIVQERLLTRIAVFHADDAFSTQAASYCAQALTQAGNKPLALASYNRHTLDLQPAISMLCNVDPRVVICISASMPTARLVNRLFARGHYGVAFYGIDSTFLVPHIMRAAGVPFSYTAVTPSPQDQALPLACQYREDLAKSFPEELPSSLSFAYYICGRLLVEAINQAASTEKQSIIRQFESMKPFTLEGFTVSFNPSNRYLFGTHTWLLEQ